ATREQTGYVLPRHPRDRICGPPFSPGYTVDPVRPSVAYPPKRLIRSVMYGERAARAAGVIVEPSSASWRRTGHVERGVEDHRGGPTDARAPARPGA
ncbi:MAG: hypothetical protein M3N56_04570, partial [Actinomycetota bacterium]|nr:hypothetical protein [Actinomycetota bacterium]